VEKQQKQIIVTSVLVIILIIAWINAFKVIKQKSKKASPAPAAPSSVPKSRPSETKPKQLVHAREEEGLEWVRCPFSGKIYSSLKGEVVDLKLMGILWDEQKPRAIINNKAVSANDTIGTYTVVEIKKKSVILNDGSRIFEIKLSR